MVWFQVDDGMWSHPKILSLSPAAGWLWTRAGAYCSQHLTDGLIPEVALRILGATEDAIAELLDAELWHDTADGYVFHDWHAYQRTRERVESEREASRKRQAKARAAKEAAARAAEPPEPEPDSESNGVTYGVTNGVTNGVSHTARAEPCRPLEIHTSQPSRDDEPVPEVVHLVEVMSESLTRLGVKHKPGASWAKTFRLMIERDNLTSQQIEKAILWAHSSDFWVGVVLSPASLRKHYEQMRIQAQRVPQVKPQDRPTPIPPTFDAAALRPADPIPMPDNVRHFKGVTA